MFDGLRLGQHLELLRKGCLGDSGALLTPAELRQTSQGFVDGQGPNRRAAAGGAPRAAAAYRCGACGFCWELGLTTSQARRLFVCRILFDELRLGEHLELLRKVFLGGAGDFLDAFAARLAAALSAPGGLTAAAVDAALEDAIQVDSLESDTHF